MALIKTILVPTDFSEPAENAVSYAVNLAEQLGAKVVLLHAFELPVLGFPDNVVAPPADVSSRMVDAAQKALDEAAAKVRRRSKVELSPLLWQGDPREVILTIAENAGANLIVMGTHGRTGIARALIGSVAENVVRESTIPVLTVHAAPTRAAAVVEGVA
ncbi:MAG TPA: universal stress protein [Labilithrix sp.]|jgi:nucleotide-binding universal stress UspA family protein|nr:universal stress protein [Labilithrix sp.]